MQLSSPITRPAFLTLLISFFLFGLIAIRGPVPGSGSVRAASDRISERLQKKRRLREGKHRPMEASQPRKVLRTPGEAGKAPGSMKAYEEPAADGSDIKSEDQAQGLNNESPFSMLFRGQREGERYDQPAQAAAFYRQKRIPEGEDELPLERYFSARDHIRQMRRHSTQAGGFVDPDAPGVNRMDQQGLGTWTFLGPGNIGGRTRALLIDPQTPNTIYAAGVAGGVWKSTNGGANWSPISDLIANLAVNSLAMDPKDSKVILAGTGEGYFAGDNVRGAGIFKTADAGVSWTRLESTANNSNFFYINDLVISPNDSMRLYAATRTGVWRSLDGGVVWTRVLAVTVIGGCLDLAIRPGQMTDYVFAACGTFAQATIYRNIDAGAVAAPDWTSVHTEVGMGRTALAISPSDPSVIYAVSASYLSGPFEDALHAVFRSTSGGDAGTWTARVRNTDTNKLNTSILSSPALALASDCKFATRDEFFAQGWYDLAIAIDPLESNRLWVGGIDLFRSDDAGANWGIASNAYLEERFKIHPDNHSITFHPQYNGTSNQMMFVGNDGGLFRTDNARGTVAIGPGAACNSTNIGIQWTSLNNSYGVTQFYHGLPFPNGTSYLGGTQDNGTLFGTNAGGPNGWREINGGDGGYVGVDLLNPLTLFAEFTGITMQKSTDGGETFGSATLGIEDFGLFINPFLLDPSDSSRLWTGGVFLWRSLNGAAHWTQASDLTAGSGNVSALAVSQTNSNFALAGMSDGYILRTDQALITNEATDWAFSRPRTGWVSSVAFDPTNKDIAYATYSPFGGSHVWRSINSGASWTAIVGTGTGALPDIPVHSIVIDPSNTARLYIGTDLGVFVSTDGGANWAVENTGFANVVTESLSLNVVSGVTQLFAFTHGRGVWRVNLNNTGCLHSISPASRSIPFRATTGSINVSAAPAGCNWTATSNVPWLTVSGSGSANGVVSYSVQNNSTLNPRGGTATIAGKSFSIIQEGLLDDVAPVVKITNPIATGIVVNTTGAIDVAGVATDLGSISRVTWVSDRGPSGTAAGTTPWSIFQIPLPSGINIITVSAEDRAGNIGRTSITIKSTPASIITTIAGTGTRGFTGDGFEATLARISRPIRLAYDKTGNLLFADADNNRIRKVTPEGIISTIAGTGIAGYNGDNILAATAQLNFPLGVAVDKNNNIFIVDNNNNRIRKIAFDSGMITTVAGNGSSGDTGDGGLATLATMNEPQNVEVNKDGDLYISDIGNHRIRKVTASSGQMSTVAGTGTGGFSGEGMLATAAQLMSPNNVSLDDGGNFYICDSGNNRIRLVTIATGMITTIVGNGSAGFSGDNGQALAASLNGPASTAIDPLGNLFLSDRGNQRIRRVDGASKVITTVAGNGTAGYNGDGIAGIQARLNGPTGLAFDPSGRLILADRDNSRVRRLTPLSGEDSLAPAVVITAPTTGGTFAATTSPIDLQGTVADASPILQVRWSNDRGGRGQTTGTNSWVASAIPLLAGLNRITVVAYDIFGNAGQAVLEVTLTPTSVIVTAVGNGTFGSGGESVAAAEAELSLPGDVDVGPNGVLYIADTGHHRIWKVGADGLVAPFAGNGLLGSSGDDGPAVNATFNMPCGVAVDDSGAVYISDTFNHRIRKVNLDGTIVTVAGTGESTFGGDNGAAVLAHLNLPLGIDVDTSGNIYFADANNHRIRKINISDGKISTIAGNGQVGFGGEGAAATSALLNFPTGVAVDLTGIVYIADLENERIRRVFTDGKISTVVGTGVAGFSGDDGQATAARLNQPYLLRTDASGNVFIADSINHRVRKFTPANGIITTVAGNGVAGSTGDGGPPKSAQLRLPSGIGIDQAGGVFIADYGNDRVRRIVPLSAIKEVVSVSAASFSASIGLAAEAVAAAFGVDQATGTAVGGTIPLPTSLLGTTVLVKDALGVERLSQLFFASAGQVNFLVPTGTADGSATITVISGAGKVSIGSTRISTVAPGIYTANSDGQGAPAAVILRIKAGGIQVVEEVAVLDGPTGRFVPLPIDLGPPTDQVFLLLFGTGIRFNTSVANVSATIGGTTGPVLFAGKQGAFVGLDQINVKLDRNLSGRGLVDAFLTVDGKVTNTIKLQFK